MKRPILKRTVKTIEVVTWTLEYEDVPSTDPTPIPTPSHSPMSPREIQALQHSLALVETLAVHATDLFYTRLFELDPSLRPLFKDDLHAQGEKLMSSLKWIVTHLTTPDKITSAVQSLGQRHARYGVRLEHYAPVGEALLWMLEHSLGNAYTQEIETTWERAFGLISGLMQETTPTSPPQS